MKPHAHPPRPRRPRFRGIALLLAALAGPAASAAPAAPAEPRQRMNLLFLLVDDWRADGYSAAGNTLLETPNIDALARDGARFTHSYVPTSVCAPNRASILSGQAVRTHGVSDFGRGFTEEQFDHLYPQLLWDAGYFTGFIGKWGVAATGDRLAEAAERFDVWQGVEEQGRYRTQDAAGKPVHATTLFAEQAAEFIRDAPADRPFALSLSFKAAHGPWHEFDPKFEGAVKEADVTIPATLTDAAFAALPERVRESRAAREGASARQNPGSIRGAVANYHRLIAGVDAAVGRIREALAAAGHADDTLIVLTGDNGHYLYEHGLHGKWLMHEESLAVPMIVLDPAAGAAGRGRVVDAFVDSLDVAPTLLDAAGLDVPREGLGAMAGASMLPLVRGEAADRPDVQYYEYTFQPWPGDIPKLLGVRTGGWKYVRYVENDPVEELFDLGADPRETVNLAADPTHRPKLEELRALANARRDAVPDRYPDPDVQPGDRVVYTALANTTGTPYDLAEHDSVGQSFTAEGDRLIQLTFNLPVWRHPAAPTAVEVEVRRGGPDGEPLVRRRVDKDALTLVEGQQLNMDVPVTPGETLYLGARAIGRTPGEKLPTKRIGWWRYENNPYDGGTAFADGEPVPAHDLAVGFAFRRGGS